MACHPCDPWTKNLPHNWLLSRALEHNKPPSALAPIWDLWTQQTFPSPCSCLGPLETTNLTQPLLLSGAFGHNKPPSALAPVWDLWTQQTYLSPCFRLGPLDTTNLPQPLLLSGAFYTTNLPQPLLLSGTFGHNKPTPALAPVWDLWTQRTYPSPYPCLGPLDTTNLPQPLLLLWDLWIQRIQTQIMLQWIRTQLKQFHQKFRCNILIVLQEWRSKPTMSTAN